ncbi:MAG: hypothetical protein AAGL96_08315 [Pseudomonadota bacterium]
MSVQRRSFVSFFFGMSLLPVLGMAAALPSPSGSVLLEVSGAISELNGDAVANFDRDMLEALDWVEVQTFTSFTEGPQTFAGPTLASLLAAVGASGGTIRATAVNDYSVNFPASHAEAHNVILALDRNGQPMRVRDKGPIWVVYPLSEQEAEKQPFDDQMIWQLIRIRIE